MKWDLSYKHYQDEMDPRLELRNRFSFSTHTPGQHTRDTISYFANVLVIVRPTGQELPEIVMSMNGKCPLTSNEWDSMILAIADAQAKFPPEEEEPKLSKTLRSPSGDWFHVPPEHRDTEIRLYRTACLAKDESAMLFFEEGTTGWRLAE